MSPENLRARAGVILAGAVANMTCGSLYLTTPVTSHAGTTGGPSNTQPGVDQRMSLEVKSWDEAKRGKRMALTVVGWVLLGLGILSGISLFGMALAKETSATLWGLFILCTIAGCVLLFAIH